MLGNRRVTATVRPLVVRPGARFACAGDGLCCTDAHALGPLTRAEATALRARDPRSVIAHARLDAPVIRTLPGGACTFLDATRCRLHAEGGVRAKPIGCRRFPLRLVATPAGGRVSTAHRCPCRTLGERPLLRAADAHEALVDRAGRLVADWRAPERVALEPRRRVSFDAWRSLEAELLAELSSDAQPESVLGRAPMPELSGISWIDVAHHFRAAIDGTACGEGLAWFGDVVLATRDEARSLRARPWRASFDRAEARSAGAVRSVRDVLADWVADEIWSMAWLEHGSFELARSELSTRVSVARTMTEMLVASGAREDRAAAEAVLVAELAGESTLWARIVRQMRVT